MQDTQVPLVPSPFPGGGREIRFKLVFYDGSRLDCREIFDPNSQIKELYEYYYDWFNADGVLLKKFHAHYHPNSTPVEITQYDPWHFHLKLNFADQHGDNRSSADPEGMTLQDVLKEIKGYIAIRQYDCRSRDPSPQKKKSRYPSSSPRNANYSISSKH
ncbi:toxin-antitoxin system TumE family protein [Paenibacillus anseongensis]|nr:DUF6516 family protein [Paenibacillus sp. CGMCC 1.16610]